MDATSVWRPASLQCGSQSGCSNPAKIRGQWNEWFDITQFAPQPPFDEHHASRSSQPMPLALR